MKMTFKVTNNRLLSPLKIAIEKEEKVIYSEKDSVCFEVEDKPVEFAVEAYRSNFLTELRMVKNPVWKAFCYLLYPVFALLGFFANAIIRLDCIKELDNCFDEANPFEQKFFFVTEATETVNITYRASKHNSKMKSYSLPQLDLSGVKILKRDENVEFDSRALKNTYMYNTYSVACLLFVMVAAINAFSFVLLMSTIEDVMLTSVSDNLIELIASILFTIMTVAMYAIPIMTIVRLRKQYKLIINNQQNK